jgi:hypothetical protein
MVAKMENTVKKLYLLVGVQNDYWSGTNVYPEDFDIHDRRLYTNETDAKDEADRRNAAAGHFFDKETQEWIKDNDDEYYYVIEEVILTK